MRVIVTGATGNVGTAVIRALADDGAVDRDHRAGAADTVAPAAGSQVRRRRRRRSRTSSRSSAAPTPSFTSRG